MCPINSLEINKHYQIIIMSDSNSDRRRRSSVDSADHNKAARSDSEDSQKQAKQNPESEANREVFIKSLSYDIDQDALEDIFGKHGKMSKCKLIMAGGRSRGIAFVEYEDAADA